MTAVPVLVTGGAGFLGSELVRQLVAAGRAVHVLCRKDTDKQSLAGLVLDWHEADLEDEPAVERVFAAVAAATGSVLDVVHLAARISYRRSEAELLRRVNVEGTRRVLAAARRVGVRRFCHVSSVAALGPVRSPGLELDDDAPLGGLALRSAYARTKAEAEFLVQEAGAVLDVVVASPAVVFGASGSASNSLHFLRRVARGTLGPVSPPGSVSVVGLGDAARGIALVLERGTRGRRYLLSESSWRVHAFFAMASELAGRRGPVAVVPRPLWRALLVPVALLDRVVAFRQVTPEALALLGMHFRFQARRARAELGWQPEPIARVIGPLLVDLARERL